MSRPLQCLPLSAVLPTRDRASVLLRTLKSLTAQSVLPAELIVVDGSTRDDARAIVEQWAAEVAPATKAIWLRATTLGAAAQRNQGVAIATQPFVWFFDDDILFEPECVARLWRAIESDGALGGVNAMIVNQRYQPPGRVSRMMFALMSGRNEPTFAGKVLGPAVNLLPEDRDDLPEVVPTEWLNTTCTIYRREALPDPLFDSIFTGYSMMEDLTLSLRVAKRWRLANARTARIYHDSQPGAHKSDIAALDEMELVNRHYVMTQVLGRARAPDYARLALWEAFQFACSASKGARLRGKLRALNRLRAAL
ncbi:MAG: glycosyltransferase family 2 protein [Alphaproteobacteria bacterium]|nr:glycosyltransferase family 2 protein [Alphaproteobacteria bacterium]